MRIQPSAVLLWGCLLAILCGLPAQAQDINDPFPAGNPAAPDDGLSGAEAYESALAGVPPASAAAGLATLPAGGGGLPPEACPPGYEFGYGGGAYPAGADPAVMNTWPQVSPYYGPALQQTYREQGLWFNDARFGGRQYRFSLEYLRANLFSPGNHTVGSTTAPPFDPLNGFAFRPWSLGQVANEKFLGFRGMPSNGIRSQFTIVNPDDSRFEASVFWIGEARDHFAPFKAGTITDLTTIRARGGLPLNDAAGGFTAPYDLGYDLFYGSQAWGSNLDWVSMPMYTLGGVKFRGVGGVKFLRINENFAFRGLDSGLSYSFDPITGLPDPTTIVDVGIPPYESDLQAATHSWLGGPELGIRYEIGGKTLKLWGQSRIAVVANREQMVLTGNQIGDGFINPFPVPTPANPFPSAFSSTRQHTHVSSVFDQSLNLELPIFSYIPILKRQYILEKATFRIGYNFLVANEILRPGTSIRWNNGTPIIEEHRSRFQVGTLNFAIDWQF